MWSPDGRYIVFGTPEGMSWTRADGAGKPEPLTHSISFQFPWSFSPDGKRLAFIESSARNGGFDLWTVPLESDSSGLRAGKPEAFLETRADERYPSFSPDGKWIAYSSDESGTPEIYVRAFPDRGGKWQISNSGGAYPMWSPNGRELFFETLDNRIMVTSYTVKGDSFMAEKPRLWSEKKLGGRPNSSKNFDLAPDGKRIVALMPVDTPDAQQSQNHVFFLDELLRRAAPPRAGERKMTSPREPSSAPTRSLRPSAPAAWAKSIAHATPSWIAKSRSRFCPRLRAGPRAPRALRARSQGAGLAQPSQHRADLRHRRSRAGDGTGRGCRRSKDRSRLRPRSITRDRSPTRSKRRTKRTSSIAI